MSASTRKSPRAVPEPKKGPRPQRPIVGGPSVLVLREKHADRYFIVNNDEELFAAAVLVLRGRLKANCYYTDPGPPPAGPDFGPADVDKLPTSLREAAMSQFRRHEERLRSHAHDKQEWDDINLVCATADGRAAWRILQGRGDHEYEGVYVEPVCTAY
jgi:hypothetical protein